MSKVYLVYDTPSDASLRYTKCVHSKDLGKEVWQVMIKALLIQSPSTNSSVHNTCILSETTLTSICGSRFLSNQTVQTVYEIGRVCGVCTELRKDRPCCAASVMGVFYIR